MTGHPLHATCVARRLGGVWRAALLFGPSGVGKSDLALRAIAAGWRLVCDDYAVVWADGGALWAAAPDVIAGRMEARGVGVLPEPALWLARVVLAVDCVTGPLERLPEPAVRELRGIGVAALALTALEASAVAKLDRALRAQAAGLDAAALCPRTAPSPSPEPRLPAREPGTKGV
ncbi:MAG TPA: serine kinase [Caulobacteraceae bacterium]